MLVNKRQEWDFYEETTAPAVKTPAPRVNTGLRAKCLTLIVILAVIAIATTVQRELSIRSGYEVVMMKAQIAKLEAENEMLKLDIAKLRSPQRIQQIATQQLGMIVPKNVYRAAVPANPSQPAAGEDKAKTAAGSRSGGIMQLFSKAEAGRGQ